MSVLMNCGICCMLISTWGVIQLSIMGIFYTTEATILIDDVAARNYDNYDDFIEKTKFNYSIVGINCFIAAALYVLMIVISFFCVRRARKNEIEEAKIKEDDDLSCAPKAKMEKKPKK